MYGKYLKNCSPKKKKLASVESRRDSLRREVTRKYKTKQKNLDRKITFSLAHNEKLRVNVYDLQGNHLKSLYSGFLARGDYDLDWKGATEKGERASEGLYMGFVEGCSILKVEPIYLD